MKVLHRNLNPHTGSVSMFSNKLLLCDRDSTNEVEACFGRFKQTVPKRKQMNKK